MHRFAILFLIAVSLLHAAAADDSFFAVGDAKASLAILESDASIYEKSIACQKLAVLGDASSVQSLVGLVDHPKLSTYALTALAQIPGEQADSAMISAVNRLEGRPLMGLLHAIGQRRLVKSAAEAIGVRMKSGKLSDAEMQAAIQTLGNIGTMDALKILSDPALKIPDSLSGRLLADALQKCKTGVSKTESATVGDPVERVAKDLEGGDVEFQHALMTARAVGATASAAIVEKLPSLPPSRQAIALICLGDLGGGDTITAARDLIDSDDDEVAVRAVEAVAKLGGFDDAAQMPAFVGSRPELASRFMTAIATVANPAIDQDVIQSISKIALDGQRAADEMQIAYIEYVTIRRLSSATPLLLSMSSNGDPRVRDAAVVAAGLTVDREQFPSLIERVIDQRIERPVAVEALQRACVHLPQDTTAETIGASIDRVDPETRFMLLNQLAFLGGPKALQIVTALAATRDEGAIDAATQVLGAWPTADVAAPLLGLADTLPQGKFQLRALRGYLRVGRQLDMSREARLELCKNGLERAARDDERILVLDILRRFPSEAGFVWLAELLRADKFDDRRVTNRAFTTLAHVANRVALDDASAVSRELARIDLTKAPATVRSTLEALQ